MFTIQILLDMQRKKKVGSIIQKNDSPWELKTLNQQLQKTLFCSTLGTVTNIDHMLGCEQVSINSKRPNYYIIILWHLVYLRNSIYWFVDGFSLDSFSGCPTSLEYILDILIVCNETLRPMTTHWRMLAFLLLLQLFQQAINLVRFKLEVLS